MDGRFRKSKCFRKTRNAFAGKRPTQKQLISLRLRIPDTARPRNYMRNKRRSTTRNRDSGKEALCGQICKIVFCMISVFTLTMTSSLAYLTAESWQISLKRSPLDHFEQFNQPVRANLTVRVHGTLLRKCRSISTENIFQARTSPSRPDRNSISAHSTGRIRSD